MIHFSPQDYGVCQELLAQAPRIPLGPGQPATASRDSLKTLQWQEIGSNQEMAKACWSGLWLRFGFLDESHTISQDLHTPEGSYWHAIMHRHEPDYPNAKYWYRNVGIHPIFGDLANGYAAKIQDHGAPDRAPYNPPDSWDPLVFVDLCEAEARNGSHQELCLSIIQLEWELLFDHCFRAAQVGC